MHCLSLQWFANTFRSTSSGEELSGRKHMYFWQRHFGKMSCAIPQGLGLWFHVLGLPGHRRDPKAGSASQVLPTVGALKVEPPVVQKVGREFIKQHLISG